MPTRAPFELHVNGTRRSVEVAPDRRLIDVLRDDLGLVGTKEGCDDGTCGTCTVLVDGRMVRACRALIGEVPGREVVTIEGLGTPEHPHPLQAALVEADAVQCGFCTPGIVMAAAALLEREPHPSRERIVHWLGSNLCRCTGYQSIVDAVDWVVRGSSGPVRPWPWRDGVDRLPPSPRVDGMAKATGRAIYAADVGPPGVLHARAVRSPHPHADVLAIRTDRALAMPGVVAVLTATDIPGENSFGRKIKDQPVLAADRVRQIGDPVALVVAMTREEATAALTGVEVDYGLLPMVDDPEAALAEGAERVHPGGNLLAEHRLTLGNTAAAFATADVVVEGVYTTPWNEHAYLEPESAVAGWEDGTLVVRTATQYPHYQQAEIARTLGLEKGRVRVAPTVVGGAFGGKTEISCQCFAALAAYHTGRPVKIVYDRAESFASTTKRHPFRIRARTGARWDGSLVALELDMLADTGAYASFGPGLMVKAFASAAGPYCWEAIDLHGRVAFTNHPTAGAMRGPGTTQVAFALECQIDRVAERLGLDPLELRMRNGLRRGDRLLSGERLAREPGYDRTLEAIRPHWVAAMERVAGAEPTADGRRRGVGIASIWYGIGGGGGGPTPGQDPALTVGRGPGRAVVALGDDGRIVVRTGAMDLGQGAATALARIAADQLGLPLDRIDIECGDTALTPDAGPTVGSRITFFVGNAVRRAAADLHEAILGSAGAALGVPFPELVPRGDRVQTADGSHGIDLAEVRRRRVLAGQAVAFEGDFDASVPAYAPAPDRGEPYAMYVTGTQLAEVEVDATGNVRVLRVVAAHDVGRPVFPQGLVGQIEGGVAMGLGFALTEAFVPGSTHGFRDYRIPRTRDMPEVVTILVDGSNTEDPPELAARGVAECSNMVVAPAIANAIAQATGRRIDRLPIDPGRRREA